MPHISIHDVTEIEVEHSSQPANNCNVIQLRLVSENKYTRAKEYNYVTLYTATVTHKVKGKLTVETPSKAPTA